MGCHAWRWKTRRFSHCTPLKKSVLSSGLYVYPLPLGDPTGTSASVCSYPEWNLSVLPQLLSSSIPICDTDDNA